VTRLLGWLALLVAGAVVATAQAWPDAPSARPRSVGRWEVVFDEPFDGDALDAERWGTCHWWDLGDGCTILSNDEQQWYQPEGVEVRDGNLRLTATPQRSTHLEREFAYRSGMVSTGRPGDDPDDVARFAFTYGSVEVRSRTPAGTGLWPAIWMLPVTNESRPEIDLLEQYGEDTREASMTLHAMEGGERVRDRHYEPTDDLSEGWHTVGIDWTDEHVIWFLDGREVFRVEGPRVPREPMYLVLNLAVRGGEHAPDDDTSFPATFLVDRVTVWRQT
jgi:beta-glucanase (GH16 family)